MFLYGKQKNTIINLDVIKDIFLGREEGSVAISFKNGSTTKFVQYNSEVEAKEAISMLAERLAVSNRMVVNMPELEEVKIRLRNTPLSSSHHVTGKKTKGHGGS